MTLLVSDDEVRALCDVGDLVDALEAGLSREAKGAGTIAPERLNLAFGENFLRVMPALLPEVGLMGLKFFHGSLAKGVRYIVAVCALESGEVLGLVDAQYLTAARTGATSGVATKWLSRKDSHSVGVIGSGLEAETNLLGVCSVRHITEAKVFSRSARRRELFAERMSAALGIPVEPRASAEEAVASTDIVVVATNTGPDGGVAYRGEWLESGQHVVSIGSTTPTLREIDPQTFLSADTVVVDAQLTQLSRESGDVAALLHGAPRWDRALGLSELLNGGDRGRTKDADITLFKSVGSSAQDLISADFIVREATARGLGSRVGDIAAPKTF